MKSLNKINAVGILSEVILEKDKVLNLFTKAGNYRGGKIYSHDKVFTIISGMVNVTTFENDEDCVKQYKPGILITIKKDIPNIFYFPEDTQMLEWFPVDAKREKYERYYEMKK